MMKGSAQLTTCGVALSLNAVSLHNNIRKTKDNETPPLFEKFKAHQSPTLFLYS